MKFSASALALGLALTSPAFAQGPSPEPQPLRMVSIDVEGGGATLFVTPEGESLLVDTGWPSTQPASRDGIRYDNPSSAEMIVAAATELGVDRFDYLLISHYHLDHVGGIQDLLARIPVGTVIDHGENRETGPEQARNGNLADRLYAAYQASVANLPRLTVTPGDKLRIGSLNLDFVASDAGVIQQPIPNPAAGLPVLGCATPPPQTQADTGENHRSVGFVATFGGTRILHLADLTWNVELDLVCPTNKLGQMDILLVSHHGSGQSTTPQLLEAIQPRIAVLGNGSHKGGDARVLEALDAAASAPQVWQQHSALRHPQHDVAQDRVANLAVHDGPGYALEAAVWATGQIRVTNRRNGHSETYGPRAPW